MSIIGKAENVAENLIQNSLTESWLLNDLEQDLRRLQDLSYKTKAQLLLWDEINEEFAALSESLPANWTAIQNNTQLSIWASENEGLHASVMAYMEEFAGGINEKSYSLAGQTVDFQLFPSLTPNAGEYQRTQ